jgi:hypothetical protein
LNFESCTGTAQQLCYCVYCVLLAVPCPNSASKLLGVAYKREGRTRSAAAICNATQGQSWLPSVSLKSNNFTSLNSPILSLSPRSKPVLTRGWLIMFSEAISWPRLRRVSNSCSCINEFPFLFSLDHEFPTT